MAISVNISYREIFIIICSINWRRYGIVIISLMVTFIILRTGDIFELMSNCDRYFTSKFLCNGRRSNPKHDDITHREQFRFLVSFNINLLRICFQIWMISSLFWHGLVIPIFTTGWKFIYFGSDLFISIRVETLKVM